MDSLFFGGLSDADKMKIREPKCLNMIKHIENSENILTNMKKDMEDS